ncbi:MAG: hypothetical protein M3115_07245 [Thermoproteota archaeon]|nr:hypothetical protein [Thermoproteota archaeon]
MEALVPVDKTLQESRNQAVILHSGKRGLVLSISSPTHPSGKNTEKSLSSVNGVVMNQLSHPLGQKMPYLK